MCTTTLGHILCPFLNFAYLVPVAQAPLFRMITSSPFSLGFARRSYILGATLVEQIFRRRLISNGGESIRIIPPDKEHALGRYRSSKSTCGPKLVTFSRFLLRGSVKIFFFRLT